MIYFTNSKMKNILVKTIFLILIIFTIFSYDFLLQYPYRKNNLHNSNISRIQKNHSYFIERVCIINNFSETALKYDWCYGNGSSKLPYIIENLTVINQTNYNGILIKNTSAYFIIRNCYIGFSKLNGILLSSNSDIKNGKITNNTIFNNSNMGIRIEHSENNIIISENRIIENRIGIGIVNSFNTSILNNTIQDNINDGILSSLSNGSLIENNTIR
ncbi:MAG: hypothetical protein GF329_19985, partial [Candidatus Lokiarchaeota archaeon]|nr:hypothetical protein [Candidatus Lokiarchaeota archaeon]